VAYDAMFKASANTIKTLTANSGHIGGDLPDFSGALHTWGSQLQYYPHIYYVVAGVAYCNTSGNWSPSRIDFFLPVRAMSADPIGKYKPDAQSISSGRYRFSRLIYIYAKKRHIESIPGMQEFLYAEFFIIVRPI
jgi:hypothetical protein